jgi:protein-glutamine gamma-glutamyltransferase
MGALCMIVGKVANNIDKNYLHYLGRSFWIVILIQLFVFFLPSATPNFLLTVSGVTGIYVVYQLKKRGVSTRGLLSFAIILLSMAIVVKYGLPKIDNVANTTNFFFYKITEHFWLVALFFIISLISTTLYFWSPFYTIGEFFLIVGSGAALFSAHRNFQIDAPKVIANLSWYLGLGQLKGLVLISGVFIFLAFSYLYLGLAAPKKASFKLASSASLLSLLTGALLLITIISIDSFKIYQYYDNIVARRVQNGVGSSSNKEDDSPLNFYSSLGGSSDPTALVKLNNDYTNNPYSPILYFREMAVSKITPAKMVLGDPRYDKDIPRKKGIANYSNKEDSSLYPRTKLEQVIYLITNHETSFAVDYPIKIDVLNNPNPNRFKAAYKALSLAPQKIDKEKILNLKVGNPEWSKKEWSYYTKQHPDLRYAEYARRLTLGVDNPISKAFAITQYFTEEATYTLNTGHSVKLNEDPVAPFLFGDLRGYCVHFAHATVYLLRSLNIPARIATGYLTDMNQSKDGHILLRSSDRHAWAEVYIHKLGWVAFDVHPKKVESHATTQVDLKQLEELMGVVQNEGESLPEEVEEKDLSKEKIAKKGEGFKITYLYKGLLLAILVVLIIKLFTRFAWLFVSTPPTKARYCYLSLVSLLYDLGIKRLKGETKLEFTKRVAQTFNLEEIKLANLINEHKYRIKQTIKSSSRNDLIIDSTQELGGKIPFLKKLWSWINPSSSLAFLFGEFK